MSYCFVVPGPTRAIVLRRGRTARARACCSWSTTPRRRRCIPRARNSRWRLRSSSRATARASTSRRSTCASRIPRRPTRPSTSGSSTGASALAPGRARSASARPTRRARCARPTPPSRGSSAAGSRTRSAIGVGPPPVQDAVINGLHDREDQFFAVAISRWIVGRAFRET